MHNVLCGSGGAVPSLRKYYWRPVVMASLLSLSGNRFCNFKKEKAWLLPCREEPKKKGTLFNYEKWKIECFLIVTLFTWKCRHFYLSMQETVKIDIIQMSVLHLGESVPSLVMFNSTRCHLCGVKPLWVKNALFLLRQVRRCISKLLHKDC